MTERRERGWMKKSELLYLIEAKRRLDIAISRLEGRLESFWVFT